MKFHDFTLVGGTIHSRRVFDTSKLGREGGAKAASMLAELRRGAEFVAHPFPSLPPFGVSLGPPAWVREENDPFDAPCRFFVWESLDGTRSSLISC